MHAYIWPQKQRSENSHTSNIINICSYSLLHKPVFEQGHVLSVQSWAEPCIVLRCWWDPLYETKQPPPPHIIGTLMPQYLKWSIWMSYKYWNKSFLHWNHIYSRRHLLPICVSFSTALILSDRNKPHYFQSSGWPVMRDNSVTFASNLKPSLEPSWQNINQTKGG